MPTVRISEDTMSRLKSFARPLEDTVDDVVNRALDALDGASPKASPKPLKRRTRGKKLPQSEFRAPLLKLLKSLGGRASVKVIRDKMELIVAPLLGEADYAPVSTGDPRWWNAVCWERNDMKKEGILRKDSERGIWEVI